MSERPEEPSSGVTEALDELVLLEVLGQLRHDPIMLVTLRVSENAPLWQRRGCPCLPLCAPPLSWTATCWASTRGAFSCSAACQPSAARPGGYGAGRSV